MVLAVSKPLSAPIGLFDSGVGGLSVAKSIHQLLPNENFIYIADSLHAPYGNKSTDYIHNRSKLIIEFLIQQQAKIIVIACNTITVSIIKQLRTNYDIPIIGVEPGIKPAAATTKSNVIGVLATESTIKSASLNRLVAQFGHGKTFCLQACPGLVEQIENKQIDSKKTRELLLQYTQPMLQQGIDTLVMGCTHYAFLEPVLRRLLGNEIHIINTYNAVAKQTHRQLTALKLLTTSTTKGSSMFYSSDINSNSLDLYQGLWGHPVEILNLKT